MTTKKARRAAAAAAAAQKTEAASPPKPPPARAPIRALIEAHSGDARLAKVLAVLNEYLTAADDSALSQAWRRAAIRCHTHAVEVVYETFKPPGLLPCSTSYELMLSQKELYMFHEEGVDGAPGRMGFGMRRFQRVVNRYFDKTGEWTARAMAYLIFIALVMVERAYPHPHPRQKKERPIRFCAACAGHRFGTHRCRGCDKTHYCSEKCQRAHWPAHRASCFRCDDDDAAAVEEVD
jgi:hypothetical protein